MKNKKYTHRLYYIILSTFSFLAIAGCATTKSPIDRDVLNPPNLDPITENVKEIEDETVGFSSEIEEQADDTIDLSDTIQEQANTLKSSEGLSEEQKQLINSVLSNATLISSNINDIKNNVQRFMDYILQNMSFINERIEENQAKIDDVMKLLGDSRQEFKDLKEENRELKNKARQNLTNYLGVLIVISIAGIGVSGFLLFLTRSKTAIATAVGFLITLVVSVGINLYMNTIGLISVIIICLAFMVVVVYFIYRFYLTIKSEEELVVANDTIAEKLSDEAQIELFGHDKEGGIISQMQSKSTKKQIEDIRKDKNKIEKIKKNISTE